MAVEHTQLFNLAKTFCSNKQSRLTAITAANTSDDTTNCTKKDENCRDNENNDNPSLKFKTAVIIDCSTTFKIIECV